ncbi:MAG: hypothetical protein RJB10_719, partial [Pseudomonadota bacterium]
RLRAFGNYNFRIADAKLFHTEISGTRESYSVEEVDGQLRGLVLQNISNAIASSNIPFPEELQKILDQKIGMGMVGNDMGKFMQYQTAQAIPKFAEGSGGGSGIAGDAMGMGAGLAMGQVLAQNLQAGLNSGANQAAAAAAATVKPDDIMATLEKLGELKTKGILTQEEFDSKKAELLKKLV